MRLVHFYFGSLKISEKEDVQEKLSWWFLKQERPRLAIREPDPYQPRDAQVQPCEWPYDEFMIEAGFKDEFDALVHNVGLEEFISDKCEQYVALTASFVRRFKFSARRETSELFDLYDKSYTMDFEGFNRI